MKKIFMGLALCLSTALTFAQNGLESVDVEKYYVSNAADDSGSVLVPLPVGSVTYRIYANMLPGYKFQALYGVSSHTLLINTSTTFFNNEDRGATTANAIASAQLKNNSVALDSLCRFYIRRWLWLETWPVRPSAFPTPRYSTRHFKPRRLY